MKTAISIPDETFERAERAAAELGVSRSQFYVSAVERYMQELIDNDLTRRINEALEIPETDEDRAEAQWMAEAARQLFERADREEREG